MHIPFCAHRCPYCDFAIEIKRKIPEDAYVESLIAELKMWSKDPLWRSRPVSTIFFGGGTPSLFQPASLKKIISTIRELHVVKSSVEISMEANPGFVKDDIFLDFAEAGINRVSLGAQSFLPKTLKTLGRHHTSRDIIATIKSVREAGIDNLSVDLIYGVPGQSIADLSEDISNIAGCDLPHVSAYCLTIEKGTSFFRSVERGTLALPKEEIVLEMMDLLEHELPLLGLNQYEISNFARSRYQSKHNLGYWTGVDYLGLGMGAHSYCKSSALLSGSTSSAIYARRWANYSTLDGYQSRVKREERPLSWSENIGRKDAIFEALYLGLRKKDGVRAKDLVTSFGEDAWSSIRQALEPIAKHGWLVFSDEGWGSNTSISLTKAGRRLADSVSLELHRVLEDASLG